MVLAVVVWIIGLDRLLVDGDERKWVKFAVWFAT